MPSFESNATCIPPDFSFFFITPSNARFHFTGRNHPAVYSIGCIVEQLEGKFFSSLTGNRFFPELAEFFSLCGFGGRA
jgi:hypothetical protein